MPIFLVQINNVNSLNVYCSYLVCRKSVCLFRVLKEPKEVKLKNIFRHVIKYMIYRKKYCESCNVFKLKILNVY